MIVILVVADTPGKMDSLEEQKDKVHSSLATAYKTRVSNVRQSIGIAQQALAVSREMGDPALVAKSLNHLSLFAMIIGDNDLAVNSANEAIGHFSKLEDELGIADAKFNIGSVYYKTDGYHSGLIQLVNALATYKKFGEHAKESRVHKALGTIYEFFGDEKNALTSYQLAIEAARKAGDQNLESNAYNPISGIYLDRKDLIKAVEYIEKSIAIKKRTGDVRGLAFALYGRGKINTYTRNYSEAEIDFKEAERIHLLAGEKLGLAMNYYKLGLLYNAMERTQDALSVLLIGRTFSAEHNISQFRYKCDFQLYKIYKEQGDIELAMFYLEEYLEVKDKVINIETLKIIENYELITKQQLIENSELLKAKEQADIQNRKLTKANAELDQFVYRASHDLRAPLSSIMGLVNLGLRTENRQEAQRCFELIDDRVQVQDSLIKEIVDYSRNSRLALDIKNINIKNFIHDVIKALFFMDGAEQIRISVFADDNLAVSTDPYRLKSIINNLVSNAIKYHDPNKPKQFINISVDFDDSSWTLTVEDNGVGMKNEIQAKVFDMFYRGTELSSGSGLGLFIVKETVNTLGGTIRVESSLGHGAKFQLSFPHS